MSLLSDFGYDVDVDTWLSVCPVGALLAGRGVAVLLPNRRQAQ